MAQDPLHLLCLEPRFPGRLGPVADWLVRRRGYRVRFFTNQVAPAELWPPSVGSGLELIQYNVGGVARETAVPWTRNLERGLCHAYGAWEVIHPRREGSVDIILGRSCGLGSTLFTPVSYPGVPTVNMFDYYYHPHAHDLVSEDEPRLPPEYIYWRRAANAMDLLDLENGVMPWAPTRWQRDLYPPEYRGDFFVAHDGIDASLITRREHYRMRMFAGRLIPPGTRIVSFVATHLDRSRGFDRFLALANRLLSERSDVVCVVIGGGTVDRAFDILHFGRDFGALALSEVPPVDSARFWTLGSVAPSVATDVLSITDLHVVPSRPFPVARSLLESLAAGAVVLAWDTAPVREIIEDGHNGLLVPPDDPEAAVRLALQVLDDPAAHRPLADRGQALAREKFDRSVTLPALAGLFDRLVAARRGPSAQAHRAALG